MYQEHYKDCDEIAVAEEIIMHGAYLSDGQCLFHGGAWWGDGGITKPLSTSFSAQVAFQNALWKGKAYDSNRLDLVVLRALKMKSKAFVFKQKGTDHAHELEVLIAAGANLKVMKTTQVRIVT